MPLPDPPVTPRPDVAPDHVAPNAATATPPVSQLHSKAGVTEPGQSRVMDEVELVDEP